MKRINHKMPVNIGKMEPVCINCKKKLSELIQELIDSKNVDYDNLDKLSQLDHVDLDILNALFNIIESVETCITEDEAMIKDIIE